MCGCLGVLVALILMAMAANHVVRPGVLLVLWPSSIAGIADPSTPLDKIIIATLEIGGNFLLYGIIGMLIGLFFVGSGLTCGYLFLSKRP
jgi:hypothetical protein